MPLYAIKASTPPNVQGFNVSLHKRERVVFSPDVISQSQSSDVIHTWQPDNGFEQNTFEWECRASQYSLDTGIKYVGTQSGKFFQEGDKTCVHGTETKHRTQLLFRDSDSNRIRIAYKTHYWFGFAFYFPASFPTTTSVRAIWYGMISAGVPGDIAAYLLGTPGDSTKRRIELRRRWRNGSLNEIIEANVDVTVDAWHTHVTHIYRAEDNTGEQQQWIDDVQYTDLSGVPTGTDRAADGDADPFMKIGLYWGSGNRSGDYTCYIDSFRIAQATSAYAQVDPAQDL